jgi:hypothetical protein
MRDRGCAPARQLDRSSALGRRRYRHVCIATHVVAAVEHTVEEHATAAEDATTRGAAARGATTDGSESSVTPCKPRAAISTAVRAAISTAVCAAISTAVRAAIGTAMYAAISTAVRAAIVGAAMYAAMYAAVVAPACHTGMRRLDWAELSEEHVGRLEVNQSCA